MYDLPCSMSKVRNVGKLLFALPYRASPLHVSVALRKTSIKGGERYRITGKNS